jgi:four helix bundle protein
VEGSAQVFKFEKLDVWQKAVHLYEEVSLLSLSIDQRDQFSLGEQIRKAALSVSTNIAEGTGREGEKESKHFFNIAKGSVYELGSLLYVMRVRKYVSVEKYGEVYAHCDEIARMITGILKK